MTCCTLPARVVGMVMIGLLAGCPGDRPRIEPLPESSAAPVRPGSPRAEPSEPAPAREVLDFPDHGFQLVAPGDGTELLGTDTARGLHAGAVAALRKGTSCLGLVLPFPAETGASLKATAAARLADLGLEGPEVVWNDLVRYCEQPAVRAAVNGRRDGVSVRTQQTVVLLTVDGRTRGWEVRVESSAPVFGEARRCHDRLTAAFELTEGI